MARLLTKLRHPSIRRWGAGLFEQGLIALTSLATLAILSRLMPLDELGIVATGLALWMLLEALQRATVIFPFIAVVQQPERDPVAFGAFIIWNLLLCVGAGLLLMLLGAGIATVNAEFGRAVVLGGPLAAAGCLFLFVRHALYQLERPFVAAANALGVALLVAGGLLLLAGRSEVHAGDATLVIAIAYSAPSLLLLVWISRRATFSWQAVLELVGHRQMMAELTAASLALHIATNGAQLLLGLVSGPASVAVFALGRTLVRPLTLIVHAIVDIDRSRLSRQLAERGAEGLHASVTASRLALIWLTAAPVIIILLYPEPLLALFYGEAGGSAVSASRLWVAALIPFILYEPLEAAMSVMRESRKLARANLLALGASAVVVGGALVLGRFDVEAAIVSIGIAYLVCMIVIYRDYGRVRRGREGAAP